MLLRDILKAGLCGIGLLAKPLAAFCQGVFGEREQPESLKFTVDTSRLEEWCNQTHLMLGQVNSDYFLGNAPGTVQLISADWQWRPEGKSSDTTTHFRYSKSGFDHMVFILSEGRMFTVYSPKKVPFKPLLVIGKRVA
jgi:hypothetical protein